MFYSLDNGMKMFNPNLTIQEQQAAIHKQISVNDCDGDQDQSSQQPSSL
jgi:hypothetical protein